MSFKRYVYKVVETAELADFETALAQAGRQGWAPVGYGVLPNGHRSMVLQKKVKVHGHKHRHADHHHDDEAAERSQAAASAEAGAKESLT